MITRGGSSRPRPDGTRETARALATDPQRLLLADGKRRKVARPKRKKLGHVTPRTERLRGFDHPAVRKLQEGEPVSDRELRRALAAFKEGISLGER